MSEPPHIHPLNLSTEERRIVYGINTALSGLNRFVQDFQAALNLYNFSLTKSGEYIYLHAALSKKIAESSCQQGHLSDSNDGEDFRSLFAERRRLSDEAQIFHDWMNIAGRDGSMSIFHIGKTIETLKGLLHSSPSLNRLISKDILRSSERNLNSTFPSWELLRHAVGHRAELTSTPKKRQKNATSKPFNVAGIITSKGLNTMVHPQMTGRTFFAINKGEALSYELSQSSLEILLSVREDIFEAFRPAEKEFKRQADERIALQADQAARSVSPRAT